MESTEKQQLLELFSKQTNFEDVYSCIIFTKLLQIATEKEIIDYMLITGRWVKKEIQ